MWTLTKTVEALYRSGYPTLKDIFAPKKIAMKVRGIRQDTDGASGWIGKWHTTPNLANSLDTVFRHTHVDNGIKYHFLYTDLQYDSENITSFTCQVKAENGRRSIVEEKTIDVKIPIENAADVFQLLETRAIDRKREDVMKRLNHSSNDMVPGFPNVDSHDSRS